ncbi:alpha/beta hydrolase [Burkholderia pseudomallei]|nr:alpha/beta hydrolase [Burkholderia pseudomallei]
MRGGGLRDEMRDEMHGEWPKSNRRRFKRTLVRYLTIFIDAI